jgi:hypothetical protein
MLLLSAMLGLVALHIADGFGVAGPGLHTCVPPPVPYRQGTIKAMESAAPTQLAQSDCMLELEAVTDSGVPGEARMGEVLDWLSGMLVNLDLHESDDGGEETDEDFVLISRPWLHCNEFHAVAGVGIAEQIWAPIVAADFLEKGANGGSMVIFLPEPLPMPLFERVVDAVSAAATSNVNADLQVTGCHPEMSFRPNQTPSPLIRVFLDSETLFIDGKLSDAAGMF